MQQIDDIRNRVLSGEIKILDYQLIPVFDELRKSLNVDTIDGHSKAYSTACILLENKLEELKNLISSSEMERKLVEFLENQPSDVLIAKVFNNCWKKPLVIERLSYDFLKYSKDLLCKDKTPKKEIQHEEYSPPTEDYIIKIQKQNFTEEMTNYFESIRHKLPCTFNELFEDEPNRITACQNFVFLMHLIQYGKIHYQKETDHLYL